MAIDGKKGKKGKKLSKAEKLDLNKLKSGKKVPGTKVALGDINDTEPIFDDQFNFNLVDDGSNQQGSGGTGSNTTNDTTTTDTSTTTSTGSLFDLGGLDFSGADLGISPGVGNIGDINLSGLSLAAESTGDTVKHKDYIKKFLDDVITHAVSKVEVDKNTGAPSFGGGSVYGSYETGASVPIDANTPTPLVSKEKLQISPKDFASSDADEDNTHTSVATRGGKINASALADLFMIYGRNLTSIRKCTINIRVPRTKIGTSYTEGSGATSGASCSDHDPTWVDGEFRRILGEWVECVGGFYSIGPTNDASISADVAAGAFDNASGGVSGKICALSSEYAMTAAQFKAKVEEGTNPFDNLKVGGLNQGQALINLINKIKAVVDENMENSAGTFNVYSCHSSCHSSCHGSRGRR